MATERESRNGEAANAFDRWFTASVHWLRGLEISKDNAWIIFQDGWTARERAARSESAPAASRNGEERAEGLSTVQLAEIERHVLAAKDWTPFYVQKIKEAFEMAASSSRSERRDTIAIAALQRALTMQTGGIFNHMTAPPELAARCSCPQCVRECVEAALGKLGANHEPAKDK